MLSRRRLPHRQTEASSAARSVHRWRPTAADAFRAIAPATTRCCTHASRLDERARHNADNLTRTAFYLAYWRAHPEVTWALLAHLVSRNAGYQMTDLRRHIERCQRGRRWLVRLGF